MATTVMVEPHHTATTEGSAVASLDSVTKRFGRQTALDRFFWFSLLALGTLGYSDSSAFLAWALLASYAVVFLLTAAFIFRRQEAQA